MQPNNQSNLVAPANQTQMTKPDPAPSKEEPKKDESKKEEPKAKEEKKIKLVLLRDQRLSPDPTDTHITKAGTIVEVSKAEAKRLLQPHPGTHNFHGRHDRNEKVSEIFVAKRYVEPLEPIDHE